jgi:hypothetical protein
MRQTLHKRLEKLEQDVQARQASAKPESSDHIEVIRGRLRAWGVEQQPEESLAMTLCRAMGISGSELRRRLEARACAQ